MVFFLDIYENLAFLFEIWRWAFGSWYRNSDLVKCHNILNELSYLKSGETEVKMLIISWLNATVLEKALKWCCSIKSDL